MCECVWKDGPVSTRYLSFVPIVAAAANLPLGDSVLRGLPLRCVVSILFHSLSDFELDVKHAGISKGFALMMLISLMGHATFLSAL